MPPWHQLTMPTPYTDAETNCKPQIPALTFPTHNAQESSSAYGKPQAHNAHTVSHRRTFGKTPIHKRTSIIVSESSPRTPCVCAGDTPSVKRTSVWGAIMVCDYGHDWGNYGTTATHKAGGHGGARPCMYLSI